MENQENQENQTTIKVGFNPCYAQSAKGLICFPGRQFGDDPSTYKVPDEYLPMAWIEEGEFEFREEQGEAVLWAQCCPDIKW